MSASTSDKITDTRNGARPISTTVSVNRNTGGNSLTCTALTGWPTASKVHLVTYKVDTNSNPIAGTQMDCYGIVVDNTITSFAVLDGTDSGHTVGDIVEMLPTSSWGQDLADALEVAHNRDGSLKTVGVANGGTGVATLTDGGVLVGNAAGVIQATTVGTAGQVLTSNGAGLDPTFQPTASNGYYQLLTSNSGTDTGTSATNLDTFSISGLSAKDKLKVIYTFSTSAQATQSGGTSTIYNNTDSVTLGFCYQGGTTLPAGRYISGEFTLSQEQSSNVLIHSLLLEGGASTGANSFVGGEILGGVAGVATAWTGSWTLALRYGGMVSGGTGRWSWAVYRVAAQ